MEVSRQVVWALAAAFAEAELRQRASVEWLAGKCQYLDEPDESDISALLHEARLHAIANAPPQASAPKRSFEKSRAKR